MAKPPKAPEESSEHVIYPSAWPPLPPMDDDERRALEIRSAAIHDQTGLENEIAQAGHRLAGESKGAETDEAELDRLSQAIVASLAEIDMTYNPASEEDVYAYQMELGLQAVAGLAGVSRGDIDAYLERFVQGSSSSGSDFTRREAFRVAEGIGMLEHAYEGSYDSGDAEEHWERFSKFIYEECPSKAWENEKVLNHFLDAVRDSYKSLQQMFGPKHIDVVSALEELRLGFLRTAGLSSRPTDVEIQNMRVLSWSGWPHNDTGSPLPKPENL